MPIYRRLLTGVAIVALLAGSAATVFPAGTAAAWSTPRPGEQRATLLKATPPIALR